MACRAGPRGLGGRGGSKSIGEPARRLRRLRRWTRSRLGALSYERVLRRRVAPRELFQLFCSATSSNKMWPSSARCASILHKRKPGDGRASRRPRLDAGQNPQAKKRQPRDLPWNAAQTGPSINAARSRIQETCASCGSSVGAAPWLRSRARDTQKNIKNHKVLSTGDS